MGMMMRRYHKKVARPVESAPAAEAPKAPEVPSAPVVAPTATPLPDDFPAREELAAADVTTLEALRGATVEELMKMGLLENEATAVIAALGSL